MNNAPLRRMSGPLLACVIGLAACSDEQPAATRAASNAGPVAIPVETETVTRTSLAREVDAVGSLQSDEAVVLRPEVAGRVVRIGFAEGQAVQRGQLLFALEDSVQRAELNQASASLALARRSFARAEEMYGRKLVSQSDRDQAAANLDLARAALDLAQARLDKTHILAPFDGVSGLRRVSTGDYVTAGQDLVNLEAITTLKVDFRVDEVVLPALRTGQPITVAVDAYPDRQFAGTVYAIDPRVADKSRSIALRARLPNPDAVLRPGQFARVRLQVGAAADAVVIPEQAIFPRGERQFVYVVDNQHARLREVRIGQRRPGQVEVLSGLAAGETLVTSGLQRLGDGAPVVTQR